MSSPRSGAARRWHHSGRAAWRLANEARVVLDGPHPSPERAPSPPGRSRRRSHRPCQGSGPSYPPILGSEHRRSAPPVAGRPTRVRSGWWRHRHRGLRWGLCCSGSASGWASRWCCWRPGPQTAERDAEDITFDPAATCPAPPWSSAATPWPATGWAICKATDPGRPVTATPRAARARPTTELEDAPGRCGPWSKGERRPRPDGTAHPEQESANLSCAMLPI